jgi:hypothetical protein
MSEHLTALLQEVAKLEHEFNVLQQDLTGNEWFEVISRDLEDAQVRRQNELQAYILRAKHIIAERKNLTGK